jgi:hypothetical protein
MRYLRWEGTHFPSKVVADLRNRQAQQRPIVLQLHSQFPEHVVKPEAECEWEESALYIVM